MKQHSLNNTFAIGAWVVTPDGQGEVVGIEAGRYLVFLDRPGVEASADNLIAYDESELELAEPPQWKRMRDKE